MSRFIYAVKGASGGARDAGAYHVRITCGGLRRGKSGPQVVSIDMIFADESILVALLLVLAPPSRQDIACCYLVVASIRPLPLGNVQSPDAILINRFPPVS
jgi:hypothetical protein